jgi:ATP-binding protein involved in chromosome partitioning
MPNLYIERNARHLLSGEWMGLPILDDDGSVGASATKKTTANRADGQHDMARHQMPGSDKPHMQEEQEVAQNLLNVKRRIGVHSGKGGVGKTFIAVNLAYTLAHSGKKVGLLDCDIDCPNVVRFLNLNDMPLSGTPEGRINPLEYKGVKIVSTHFLSDEPAAPMVVRGPIKHKVLAELLSHVDWGELDVLILDLPPGTSDVPMSSMLIGGLTGLVVVTTPQKEAIMDARKSALMAADLHVPVLGIVENMSGDIFGSGTGRMLADELNLPFLASIPLSRDIRLMNESGKIALAQPAFFQRELLAAVAGEPVQVKRSLWNTLLAKGQKL